MAASEPATPAAAAVPASTQSFPKSVRLLGKADFDRAFTAGKRLSQDCFSAVIAANTLPHARIGFAIGKRQAPLSVTRNRLRRQFRECFRQQQVALAPVDIVLSLRRTPPDDSRAAVAAFWALIQSRCAR